MPESDPLDRLIDAALASYTDAATDVEARVLARIEEARGRTGVRRGLITGCSLALAASVVLFLVLNMRTPNTPHTIGQTQSLTHAAAPAIAGKSVTRSASPRKPRRVDEAVSTRMRTNLPVTPKLAVFPTPAPLSAEETALVRLASETTSEERKSILDAQRRAVEPLHITAIFIPPIEPPVEGKE